MQINKTDQNDAEGLPQIVRTGWYRPVHVNPPEPKDSRQHSRGPTRPQMGSVLRYFLDFTDTGELLRDYEGMELVDLEAARMESERLRTLLEMLRGERAAG